MSSPRADGSTTIAQSNSGRSERRPEVSLCLLCRPGRGQPHTLVRGGGRAWIDERIGGHRSVVVLSVIMGIFASLYAQRRGQMVCQVIVDLFMVAWAVGWWWVGHVAAETIDAAAAPLRSSRDTVRQLAEQLGQVGEQSSQVPGVGDGLRAALDGLAVSLQSVIGAADTQIVFVEQAGMLAGWLVFLLPVLLVWAIWIPARIRFARRARATQSSLDAHADLELFALRAMVTQPLPVIAKISDDPMTAWRRGDRRVIMALAAAELRRSGLNLPTR